VNQAKSRNTGHFQTFEVTSHILGYGCMHGQDVVGSARGKRRGFCPAAAARRSHSARVHTDCYSFPKPFFSDFSGMSLLSQTHNIEPGELCRLNLIFAKNIGN